MKIWQQISEIFKKVPPPGDGGKEPFLVKYQSFRELLSQNDYVLELMADMEEKSSGEYLLDRRYIDYNIAAVATGIKKIIDNLNMISYGRYAVLGDRFNKINSEVEALLTGKKEIPVSKFTISFGEINKEMTDIVGAKNANLGEVKNRLGIPTPDGFAVSSFAFKRFMEHNDFLEKIREALHKLQTDNLEVLNNTSREIQEKILKAEIPQDIEKEVLNAYLRLRDKYGQEVKVSVRSSALQEDGIYSFAGQYATFLNVPAAIILQKYKEVVASLFTSRAVFYYKTKGLHEYEMAMSVGVLEMVDAKGGGVIYSRDPNKPEAGTLIINAIHGLGRCVVEGIVTPETYIVSRDPSLEVTEKIIPEESGMVVCRSDGKLEQVPLPDDVKECLNDEQIITLAQYAVAVENHYNYPQDMEWAMDRNGRLYVLQTRPLMIVARGLTKHVPALISGYNILIEKGIIACKGVGFGKAFIVKTEEDLKNFPKGAVLVAKHASTKFVAVMNRASAIVTDIGGATIHMATLAREFQVPTIVDAGIATEVIENGQEITVDAINCIVYEGRVVELSEFSKKKEEPFRKTQLFNVFEKVLRRVVPLNLIDPEDEKFKPEFCETFHDVIRFAHQKAMQEMFKISTELAEGVEAVKLAAGIPLAVYVIDLGGGIEGTPRKLVSDNVRSIPFKAFLKGMSSLEWPEPRHVDAKGFMGMIAHTASVPEEELGRMGEKSLAFISGEYMNFSIRLGYHLSVVEAYTGENINDNYIRFFFKGGGADIDRRLRRVRLIDDILTRLDFEVKTVEDVIDAVITKYKREQLEEKLRLTGKLTVYTKQMDAVMHDDAATSIYLEQFVKEHIK